MNELIEKGLKSSTKLISTIIIGILILVFSVGFLLGALIF